MRKSLIIFFYYILFFSFSKNYSQESNSCSELEFNKLHLRTNFVRDSIALLRKSIEVKIKNEYNFTKKDSLNLILDNLWNLSDKNDSDELKNDIEFCKKYPNCQYSFDQVNKQISRQPGKNFYHEFESIYNNSSTEIKESESGKKMFEKLKYFKQSMVGSLAPNFSGLDIHGNEFSLDKLYSRKYILIDFWASWCAPCREEIPFLISLRNKYKDSDFEILAISDDEDLNKLKNTILKEEIQNWIHYSIAQNKSNLRKEYFVNGIPHKILIDKNGIIIGKWKASGELNKANLKETLFKIFGF